MKIINKSGKSLYSMLSDCSMSPGSVYADSDILGFASVMSDIISGCGKSFCIRLNANERKLINRILDLDKESYDVDLASIKKPESPLDALLKRESRDKALKVASIVKMRKQEDAVMNEMTYASKKDVDYAVAKAASIGGEVKAKKLEKNDGENISLSDLIGDNKFIEESMKHSKIRTAMASDEGWDMNKINESKSGAAAVPAEAASEHADTNTDIPSEPVKKTSRRRRRVNTSEESK